MKLETIKRRLERAGIPVNEIMIRRDGVAMPALQAVTDYEGPYPTRESSALLHKAHQIAARSGACSESRGYYTAVWIWQPAAI